MLMMAVIGCFSLTHVYSSPGIYQIHLRYASSVSPLTSSVIVVEEPLTDLQLVGPTDIAFVR